MIWGRYPLFGHLGLKGREHSKFDHRSYLGPKMRVWHAGELEVKTTGACISVSMLPSHGPNIAIEALRLRTSVYCPWLQTHAQR